MDTQPPRPKIAVAKAVTLGSAVDIYLAQIAVKPATLVRYRTILGRLLDHFGRNYALALLNQDRFVEFADGVNALPDTATKTKQLTITVAATFINWHAARSYLRLHRARQNECPWGALLTTLPSTAVQPGFGEAMRRSMKLLATEWPKEYPAGALEWLLVERCLKTGGVSGAAEARE